MEIKVAQPSVPTPNVPCVASSKRPTIWLTLGRRRAGEGSVRGFTLLLRLPSSYRNFVFLSAAGDPFLLMTILGI